jgi:isopenicillin-N epimerase
MGASRLLARAWNVGPETPESMVGAMSLAPLPELPRVPATEEGRASVQERLWIEYAIACSCILFEGRLYLRFSAQIYNGIGDYEKVARAVGGWI